MQEALVGGDHMCAGGGDATQVGSAYVLLLKQQQHEECRIQKEHKQMDRDAMRTYAQGKD